MMTEFDKYLLIYNLIISHLYLEFELCFLSICLSTCLCKAITHPTILLHITLLHNTNPKQHHFITKYIARRPTQNPAFFNRIKKFLTWTCSKLSYLITKILIAWFRNNVKQIFMILQNKTGIQGPNPALLIHSMKMLNC